MHEIFTQIFPQFLWPLVALHLHDFTTVAGLCFLSSLAYNREKSWLFPVVLYLPPSEQTHQCMLNTSYVNAGVPVLLVVQFPRDSTGSFPIHLINAKREKCYTWRKYWSFRAWENIKGYEREEDASGRLLKLGKRIRESAKQRFCIKNTPYTCLPSCHHRMVGSWVNGVSVSKWIGYWIRTWLLNKNLANGAPSSAALIGDFQQPLWSVCTSFSQSNKRMLLNLCKMFWVSAQKVLC